MAGFNNYQSLVEERKKLRRQRELIGDEIQNSFLHLGKRPEDQPWYKNFANWMMVGDIAYELYKRFGRSKSE